MPTLQLKDVEIYYEVHGEGPPMVFLSETACDGEVWKIYQVPEFSKDHRVIIHDYRGTGRSGKPSIDYTTKGVLRGLGCADGSSQGGRCNRYRPLDGRKGSTAPGS